MRSQIREYDYRIKNNEIEIENDLLSSYRLRRFGDFQHCVERLWNAEQPRHLELLSYDRPPATVPLDGACSPCPRSIALTVLAFAWCYYCCWKWHLARHTQPRRRDLHQTLLWESSIYCGPHWTHHDCALRYWQGRGPGLSPLKSFWPIGYHRAYPGASTEQSNLYLTPLNSPHSFDKCLCLRRRVLVPLPYSLSHPMEEDLILTCE